MFFLAQACGVGVLHLREGFCHLLFPNPHAWWSSAFGFIIPSTVYSSQFDSQLEVKVVNVAVVLVAVESVLSSFPAEVVT